MNKYEELKNQVMDECMWAIEQINENHWEQGALPANLTLIDFVGDSRYSFLSDYERGMLFAYLSLKSTIRKLDEKAL